MMMMNRGPTTTYETLCVDPDEDIDEDEFECGCCPGEEDLCLVNSLAPSVSAVPSVVPSLSQVPSVSPTDVPSKTPSSQPRFVISDCQG